MIAASAAAIPSAVNRKPPALAGTAAACVTPGDGGKSLRAESLTELPVETSWRGDGSPADRGEGTAKPGGAIRTEPESVRGLLTDGLPLNCNRSLPSSKLATKSETSVWSPTLNILTR